MERTKPKGRYSYINREKNRMRKKWGMIVKKERLEREWGLSSQRGSFNANL